MTFKTQSLADAPVALFLHGARFTKDNWMQLGTLQVLRSSGWRAIAIDLPGHGDTQKLAYGDNNMRAELIEAAFRFAGQGHRFLVSPSMSGKYALPYLDRYGASLLGWVALAPVGVLSWGGPGEVAHKRVRLLAMYGVRDPMVKEADRLQRMFLHEQKEVLPFAGHACYMDNTQAFHTVLQKFILSTLMDAHHEKLRKPHELDTL